MANHYQIIKILNNQGLLLSKSKFRIIAKSSNISSIKYDEILIIISIFFFKFREMRYLNIF